MKLFWDYKGTLKSPGVILNDIVTGDEIKIIELPKGISDLVKKIRIDSLEEIPEKLEKRKVENLENVFFEFKPKRIEKADNLFIARNIFDIFFNISSEHRFSHFSAELTEEEYKKIIDFLKNERIMLNKSLQKRIEYLIDASFVYNKKLKLPKNAEEKIRAEFFCSIDYVNKLRERAKELNEKSLEMFIGTFILICQKNKENLEMVLQIFIEELSLTKYRDTKKELLEISKKYKDLNNIEEKEFLRKELTSLWYANQEKILLILLNEKDDFTLENIYEKMEKYYEINKDSYEENLDFLGQQLTYDEFKLFLSVQDSQLLLNYLKLFLFCCRPNEFIKKEDVEKKFSVYEKLYKYLEEVSSQKIESYESIKDVLFDGKIKNLLLMFEEKILSLPKEILPRENEMEDKLISKKIKELRKKSYSEINKKYVDNILNEINKIELIYKELYTFSMAKIRILKRVAKKFEKVTHAENELEKNFLEEMKGFLEIKPDIEVKREEIGKKFNLINYLEPVKEFAFSNFKRAEVYYKIFLFNILFKIDEKDLEKFVKSKGYDKENYLTYFKALKRNEKNLGKEHIKYILEYLKEKDKEEVQNFIQCINYLTICSENLLIDTLDLEEYEKIVPFCIECVYI